MSAGLLLRKASYRLPHQAGLAVLRFNTRAPRAHATPATEPSTLRAPRRRGSAGARPPVRLRAHLRPWVERGAPLTVFVPEPDEFLSPVQAVERFGAARIFSELVTRLVP